MVARVTLLEPHFEGAQFGPSNIDSDTLDAIRGSGTQQSKPSDTDGKSRGTTLIQSLIGFVLLFVVLYASFRILSSSDEDEG